MKEFIKCNLCWAHYHPDTLHRCDRLMKNLVEYKRKKDEIDLNQLIHD